MAEIAPHFLEIKLCPLNFNDVIASIVALMFVKRKLWNAPCDAMFGHQRKLSMRGRIFFQQASVS